MPIGGGGLEDVTGQIGQGFVPGSGGFAMDNPGLAPDFARHQFEQFGCLFFQVLTKQSAHAQAQDFDGQEEFVASWEPGAAITGESAPGNEIMDVRMKDESARPGVQNTHHSDTHVATGISRVALEVAHQLIESFLMLGFAEAGEVGVDGGDGGTFVAEVNLDLAEVLPVLHEMGGIGVPQSVRVRCLLHARRKARWRVERSMGWVAVDAPWPLCPLAGKSQRG